MRKIILTGRLTADPEIREAKGIPFAQFDLAVGTSRKKEDGTYETDFYRCTGWRQFLSERIAKYCKKGQLVNIIGTPDINRYVDKNNVQREGVRITLDEIDPIFTGQKPQKQQDDLMDGLD